MDLRIREIILWPRRGDLDPRRVRLRLDRVNIITGQSQTGKSALIAIVDYCLGAGKCTIPVGRIRETTEWFGVLLQLADSHILVARREPGDQAQSGEMYVDESDDIVIPARVKANSNTDALKDRLDRAARLPKLPLQDRESGFGGRASFRDMAAFNFLPQHIVANPYTLFFKADTQEHQEKLKNVFPLVLGAVTPRALMIEAELRDLKRQQQRLRVELDNRRAVAKNWLAQLSASYSQARELGLLPDAPEPDQDWAISAFVNHLRAAAVALEKESLPRIPLGASAVAVRQLHELRTRELETSRAMAAERRKLLQLENLERSAADYQTSIALQSSRVAGVGWFQEALAERATQCPFCESDKPLVPQQFVTLSDAASALERASTAASKAGVILDREIADARSSLRGLEEQLNKLRAHRQLLESHTERGREQRQTLGEVYRFVGRLEQSLQNYDTVDTGSELSVTAVELDRRIAGLEAELRRSDVRTKIEDALTRVSDNARRYTRIVGVEKPEAATRLDVRNLALQVISGSRSDYLWEIGSGANWMGYHVATFLALHEHFLEQRFNPVPQFIMIDQPSQVYFPERWPGDPDPDTGEADEGALAKEGDIVGVHRIFEALSEGFRRMQRNTQIIVIDHAGEITWRGVQDIHLVENWRGMALIPDNW